MNVSFNCEDAIGLKIPHFFYLINMKAKFTSIYIRYTTKIIELLELKTWQSDCCNLTRCRHCVGRTKRFCFLDFDIQPRITHTHTTDAGCASKADHVNLSRKQNRERYSIFPRNISRTLVCYLTAILSFIMNSYLNMFATYPYMRGDHIV